LRAKNATSLNSNPFFASHMAFTPSCEAQKSPFPKGGFRGILKG
jgi:hypothetical protein